MRDASGRHPATPAHRQGISAAAFSPNYFRRFFVEEGELGRGGKGVVLLVKHMLDGVFLGHFACKRVPVGDDHEWLEKVLVEVQLLQHLSHQNLVSYRHVWLEDVQLTMFGPSVPCAFILQQYCNAGDLLRYVCQPVKSATAEELKHQLRRRSKGQLEPPDNLHGARRLSFDQIYSFFKDIASGLKYLHANGFVHRDLKPSNCLLHDTGKEVRVLVSDFGEAQMETTARRSTGATGTISYCAPEVLRPQYPGGPLGEFTVRTDIFSLGMILYFMCFNRLPYNNADNLDEEIEDLDGLREEISRWTGFDDQTKARADLPDKLYKFLKRLLSINPTERPSADEILRGISTGGGLDDSHHHHHHPHHQQHNSGSKKNAPMYEELRSSGASRISPIGSSPLSSPSDHRQGGRKRSSVMMSSSPPSPSSPRRSTYVSTTARHDESPEASNSDMALSELDDLPNGNQNDLQYRKTSNGNNNKTSLILRNPFSSSATTSSATTPLMYEPHHHHYQQTLLLPPSTSSSWSLSFLSHLSHLHWCYSRVSLAWLIRTILFVLKIVSITLPCSPRAANGWIMYPLVCIAAVDLFFLVGNRGRQRQQRRGLQARRRSSTTTITNNTLTPDNPDYNDSDDNDYDDDDDDDGINDNIGKVSVGLAVLHGVLLYGAWWTGRLCYE